MTPVPDFPSELVEAAAVVCYSLAPEHDTSTYPHGYVPYDEARPSSRENARADALEVLTALYPLIEQRVIDRLAREADGRVQRLQDAIHAADRELITIADFSIQEAADAIDSVRAGLKDALAETDVPAPDDARSVPDQFPTIDLAPERTGEGT